MQIDHNLSAIFLIYSIFSNINQMSLFSHKAYDRLITLTWKKGGVAVLVGELEPFFNWQSSISRQIRHVFNVRVHERALNDNINYAQKGCAMQLWGITLKLTLTQDYLNVGLEQLGPEVLEVWVEQTKSNMLNIKSRKVNYWITFFLILWSGLILWSYELPQTIQP